MLRNDVRLSLLTIEGIDFAAHEHIRKYKVLQHLDTLLAARLIIVPKALKEVLIRTIPLT